tara:strand:+ start:424 stop:2301 length:1878 start_codon:yes stop_codon:yes gene_type:complete
MKLTYRPEIDGLRAIAVCAVILYHAEITIFGHQPFKGGFIGVDIFFVISGYLITFIILEEIITTGSFSFKYFYERRIRRILPVLLFIMLVTLPFAWRYLLPTSFIDFSKSILYSIGFSSNFYFHYSGLEYSVQGLQHPFLHTWSLSVEEQYYILFPIILLITFKYFRKYLIHILIFGFIVSLSLAEWSSRNYPSASFYFLHTRMWELLAGSILAYFEIKKEDRSQNKVFNLILPFTGLILIGHSILSFNDEMLHPSFYTLSPIIGVCLIIWFSSKDEFITKVLSTKLFVGIGLISYSLYLWHYPIFVFVGKLNIPEGGIFKKLSIGVFIVILSIISYYFIEKPFRSRKIKFKKIFIFLFLKLLLIISICVYFLNLKFHPFHTKYLSDNRNFIVNYDYNNFSNKENVFIIGNSYADDLLHIFSNNKRLVDDYYFYITLGDIVDANYQIKCLIAFLERKKFICDKNLFSFIQTQYEKSDYVVFAEGFNFGNTYLGSDFDKIIEYLNKDKKKFIVFLDDVRGADILDIFIHRNRKLPNSNELDDLEYIFFQKVTNWRKKDFKKIKDKLLNKNIKFITRSEIFCDYSIKKCPLIENDNKLYIDAGHITNNGAKYFSKKIDLIINRLINN